MNARVLPLVGFALVLALFGFGIWWNQHNDPRAIPSPLTGKPAPPFALPKLYEPESRFGSADLAGEPYLLNVFGSWCVACRDEHPILMREGKRLGVKLVGFNYKDEAENARRFLGALGNPYSAVGVDRAGRAAIEWGVYGVPETFLIGPDGRILDKHVGPLDGQAASRLLAKAAALVK